MSNMEATMLSQESLDEWLNNFNDEQKEIIADISGLEQWPVDGDEDVQKYFESISDLLLQKAQDSEGLSPLELANKSGSIKDLFGRNIEVKDLVNLQSQLNFARSVKLFGDVCYISEDVAFEMLQNKSLDASNDSTAISTSILTRRIYLFIKLSLFERIFHNDRQQLVMKTLKSQFDI